MAKENRAQRKTVSRVMHEFKHGELKSRAGKIKNRRQAIAIALSEAGASKYQSPSENKRRLRKTKAKERKGETYQAEREGRTRAQRYLAMHGDRRNSTRAGSRGKTAAHHRGGETRDELMRRARQRQIPGRSKMSKTELRRALRGH